MKKMFTVIISAVILISASTCISVFAETGYSTEVMLTVTETAENTATSSTYNTLPTENITQKDNHLSGNDNSAINTGGETGSTIIALLAIFAAVTGLLILNTISNKKSECLARNSAVCHRRQFEQTG